jgi:glycerol-3-phosphate dehydrogenase
MPVVILGAGINGAAVARELLLNRVPVCLVDTRDLAAGTTAFSSRLIHGGLRYLEYAELRLVRESLSERERFFRLAPQFVQPLRFHIPVASRWGGIWQAARRVAGLGGAAGGSWPRGLVVVRSGLWLYDLLVPGRRRIRSEVRRVDAASIPRVDRVRYRWTCCYGDAQMLYPERFVVALLRDAARLARERGVRFDVYPYHRARRRGEMVWIEQHGAPVAELRASALINATGAWVDQTLVDLSIPARPLIGGTKGSHIVTWQPRVRALLGGDAVYAEAADGRPVFVLPCRDATLIGTTDRRFEGAPESAVASPEEIDYLLDTVNHVLPDAKLTADDVGLHYSGIRPLPCADGTRAAGAITRRHFLVRHGTTQPPSYSLVGGKLTTCRSLAEETVAAVLRDRGRTPKENSRQRLLPGAEGFPQQRDALDGVQAELAERLGLARNQVDAVWTLCGTEVDSLLTGRALDEASLREGLCGTDLPVEFVRQVIRQEWVTRLDDLVERRLMLLYDQRLSLATLSHLARLLVDEGKLDSGREAEEVARCRERLAVRFGRHIG